MIIPQLPDVEPAPTKTYHSDSRGPRNVRIRKTDREKCGYTLPVGMELPDGRLRTWYPDSVLRADCERAPCTNYWSNLRRITC